MTIARILLIFVLIVGIIIRSITNCGYIDNLIKKIKVLRLVNSQKAVVDKSYKSLDSSTGSIDEQVNEIMKKELTNGTRILYSFIMGLIPAVLACLLTKQVIDFVETCAGFLAPPFIIIFPA